MCPWPRIQGAMLDEHSLVVTYKRWRGEPRGAAQEGRRRWEGRGDCVDCNACVAVCPMGIDIRDGQQLECINCGLCIDACDDVMDQGRPAARADRLRHRRRQSAGRARRRPAAGASRIVRPRTLIYAGAPGRWSASSC